MSEIRVTTISDTAGTGPVTLTKQHAAKAWVNFDATTAGTDIRDSLNFSSISDAGTGDQNPNFTSNMANGNYAISALSNGSGFSNAEANMDGAPLTNLIRIRTIDTSDNRRDTNYVLATVHGDLA